MQMKDFVSKFKCDTYQFNSVVEAEVQADRLGLAEKPGNNYSSYFESKNKVGFVVGTHLYVYNKRKPLR